MRAALNKFFTPSHCNMKKRGFRTKFRPFQKKINVFLFFRDDDCEPFEGVSPGQRSPMASFVTRPGWDPQVMCKIKHLYVKFNKVSFGGLNFAIMY